MTLGEMFSANLKHFRATRQQSLTEFAAEIAIGRSTLHGFESGKCNTTLNMIDHIADKLHIPARSLLAEPNALERPGTIVFLYIPYDVLAQMSMQKRTRMLDAIQLLHEELSEFSE